MVESSDFNWDAIVDALNSNHVPEIFLGIVGAIAIIVAYMYVKDKDSTEYRIMVMIGVIVGAVMALLCSVSVLKADTMTLIIVVAASFALIIRPFRDVKFAIILALFGMIVVFIFLGSLSGDLEFLSTGWPRIIAAFVVGAIIYMLLGFLQDLVLLFAKILNAWPILAVLGIFCIAEAICVYTGHGSIIRMILDFIDSNKAAEMISMLL